MVTSLVLQSEDLSEDSIFTYAQFTEFAIRFGLMSESAACEESDERALIYEMWCTLARVHPEAAFIKVVNLMTIITAVLGFPIGVHNEKTGEIAKANSKIKEIESDFDEADMGKVSGNQGPVFIPFMLLAAPLAGVAFDTTGSYIPIFWGALGVTVVMMLLFTLLGNPQKPNNKT